MDAGFEARLRLGDVDFGADDAALLRAVEEHGSLHAAASALGRSYSRAHGRVEALEDAVGPLLERRRGGAGGGGSELTGEAHRLLARFARLEAALADTAEVEEVVLDGQVVDRAGELATVETRAGELTAVLFEPAERVHVSIRADAVTLHAPEDAPVEDATSARNRFPGTVEAVDRRESLARTSVAVGGGVTVPALVTDESVERLGLSPGVEVVVSFKATATRATPATG